MTCEETTGPVNLRSLDGTVESLISFAAKCGLGDRPVIGRMSDEDVDVLGLLHGMTGMILLMENRGRGGRVEQRVIVIRKIGEHRVCSVPASGQKYVVDIGYSDSNEIWEYDFAEGIWVRDGISERTLMQRGICLVMDYTVLRKSETLSFPPKVLFASGRSGVLPYFVEQAIFFGQPDAKGD